MDIALLKQLLPGEVNEFYVRNEIRADGRELRHHRKYFIARQVLHSEQDKSYSASVKLGNTHVLCSMSISDQTGQILSSQAQVSVSLSMVKDASQQVRRDLVEEKELVLRQSIKSKIESALKADTPIILTI